MPTLYNLVGNRDDLLRQLIEGLVARCERALEGVDDGEPIERTRRVFATLSSIFAEDEDFCRAALLAGQRIERSAGTNTSLGIWKRSSQIAMRICLDASEAGSSGAMSGPRRIGERAFDSYRIAAIDWMNGEIDTKGFERKRPLGLLSLSRSRRRAPLPARSRGAARRPRRGRPAPIQGLLSNARSALRRFRSPVGGKTPAR